QVGLRTESLGTIFLAAHLAVSQHQVSRLRRWPAPVPDAVVVTPIVVAPNCDIPVVAPPEDALLELPSVQAGPQEHVRGKRVGAHQHGVVEVMVAESSGLG